MREIHISDVRNYKGCRIRWHFSSRLHLSLEGRVPNRHLWLGSGAHYALAAYYGDPHRSPDSLTLAWEAWSEREIERIHQDVPEMTDEQWDEIYKAQELGKGMLDHYLMWAPTVDRFEVIMPEIHFNIPFPGYEDSARFAGMADGLVLDENGEYWLLEHKTAASFPKTWRGLFMDEQCAAYLWATRLDERFEGKHPVGVMYNFLRKKLPVIPRYLKTGALSQSKSQDTTVEIYLAELKRRDLPEVLYGDILQHLRYEAKPFFVRVMIKHEPKRLEVFAKHLANTVSEMLNPDTPMYPNPGMLGWNCNTCWFRSPCSLLQNGVDPTPLLNADYKVREVEPFVDTERSLP